MSDSLVFEPNTIPKQKPNRTCFCMVVVILRAVILFYHRNTDMHGIGAVPFCEHNSSGLIQVTSRYWSFPGAGTFLPFISSFHQVTAYLDTIPKLKDLFCREILSEVTAVMLSNRTLHNDGRVLDLYCPTGLPHGTTEYPTRDSMTEGGNFKIYLILIKLNKFKFYFEIKEKWMGINLK